MFSIAKLKLYGRTKNKVFVFKTWIDIFFKWYIWDFLISSCCFSELHLNFHPYMMSHRDSSTVTLSWTQAINHCMAKIPQEINASFSSGKDPWPFSVKVLATPMVFAQETNKEHLLKKQSQLAGNQTLNQRVGHQPGSPEDHRSAVVTEGCSWGSLSVQAREKVNIGV